MAISDISWYQEYFRDKNMRHLKKIKENHILTSFSHFRKTFIREKQIILISYLNCNDFIDFNIFIHHSQLVTKHLITSALLNLITSIYQYVTIKHTDKTCENKVSKKLPRHKITNLIPVSATTCWFSWKL